MADRTSWSALTVLMLHSIARLTTTYPRRVLAVWLVVFAAALPLAGRLPEVLTTDSGLAPGGEAVAVQGILHEAFHGEDDHQVLLVAHDAEGALSVAELEARFYAAVARVRDLPEVAQVRDPRTDDLLPSVSETEHTGLAIVRVPRGDREAARASVARMHEALPDEGPVGYYLTGGPAVEHEIQTISEADTLRAELLGLPVSLLVLVVVFGAAVAATLPLLVALASVTASFAALFLFGHLVSVAAFGQIVVTMLGLATGIDYALLMVNRFREELERRPEPRTAAYVTSVTAGRAVLFSGLTVLTALAALLVPPLAFVRTMGVASMVVMAFSVSVSVTALPALLTLLGHRVNWLRVSRRAPGTRSRAFWRGWGVRVLRRPWAYTVAGVAALLLLTLPALDMQFAFGGVRGLTGETDLSRAQSVLEELELDGLLRSYDVVIDFGERGFYHPSSVQAMARLTREASGITGTEQVYSPNTTGAMPGLLVRQYYATQETAQEGPLADLVRATVSEDGRYALMRVFPTAGMAPVGRAALHRDLLDATRELELDARVGGDYVGEEEWARTLYGNFPLAVGLVYLATFVLLGLAFRSILIPLKSLLLNTLTVGASFGVITLVFQHGWLGSVFGVPGGLGFVETSVPIFIFAIVFGLSMDYEVFLLTRVFEGHRTGMSDRDAMVHALASTGGVITSAALIMIVVFSAFLFSSVVLIKTLALGLTVAVLLDATLVRSVLVPAVMALIGAWNWKVPGPVGRVIDRVGLSHD